MEIIFERNRAHFSSFFAAALSLSIDFNFSDFRKPSNLILQTALFYTVWQMAGYIPDGSRRFSLGVLAHEPARNACCFNETF